MKLRYSIVILIALVFIIILFENRNKDEVLNKNIKKNFEYYSYDINYPYFQIDEIDNYISNFVSKNIENINYNNINDYTNLFIDYDYYLTDNSINLLFYKYQDEIDRLNYDIFDINYNISDKKITSSLKHDNNSYEYDYINDRIIDITKPMVAFTFDDGPSYNTNKIISSLVKNNATATFFLLGSKVEKYKNTVKNLVDNKMEVANHTYSHKLLTKSSKEEVLKEINNTNDIIYEVANIKPKFLRPSYGEYNKNIIKISNMPIVIWNLDTLDWKYHNSKKIINNILKNISDGDIILMHDTYSATYNAVDQILPMLSDLGYQVVSISELFYYKGIKPLNNKVYSYIK